jgi:hypothetical protein
LCSRSIVTCCCCAGRNDNEKEHPEAAPDNPVSSPPSRNTASSRKKASLEPASAENLQELPDVESKSAKKSVCTPTVPKSAQKEQRQPDPIPKEESAAAGEIVPECLAIGTSVEMLFGDGVWYEGVIQRFSARSGVYTIVFPDGDVQTAKLPDKDVRVVGQNRRGSAGAGSGKSGAAAKSQSPSLHKKGPNDGDATVHHDDRSNSLDCRGGAKKRASTDGVGAERRVGEKRESHDSIEERSKSGIKALGGARGGKDVWQAAESADAEAQPEESKHGSKARKKETRESGEVTLEHAVLSDCVSMLDRLLSARGGHYFAEPVDAEALGLADYHEIVTEPLDFSTIRARLLSGSYLIRRKSKGGSHAFGEQDGVRMREAFGRDVRKVLDNALLYNPESDRAYKAAASILDFFKKNWSTELTGKSSEPASSRLDTAKVSKARHSGVGEAADPDSDAKCSEESEPAHTGGAVGDEASGRRTGFSRSRGVSLGAVAGGGEEDPSAEEAGGCDADDGRYDGVGGGNGSGDDACNGESEDERPRRRPRKGGR